MNIHFFVEAFADLDLTNSMVFTWPTCRKMFADGKHHFSQNNGMRFAFFLGGLNTVGRADWTAFSLPWISDYYIGGKQHGTMNFGNNTNAHAGFV